MKVSVYLETTIPSYFVARPSTNLIIGGKQAVTHEFFESEGHKYDFFVSEYVLQECERGNPEAASMRLSWLKGITVLGKTPDVEPLADIYMKLLSIPHRSKIDALHLAICCVNSIDILLSWNCSHLGVNSMRIIQRYNDAGGIWTPAMMTPDQLVTKYSGGMLL